MRERATVLPSNARAKRGASASRFGPIESNSSAGGPPPQGRDPGVVGPVAAPGEQRPIVEPQQVAAVGAGGMLEPCDDRNADPGQILLQSRRLSPPARLPPPGGA